MKIIENQKLWKITKDIKEGIVEDFLNDVSVEELADILSVPIEDINVALEEELLESYKPSKTDCGHLRYSDRKVIEFLHSRGISNNRIAKVVCVNRSTIGRELARLDGEYSAYKADRDYDKKARTRLKPTKLKSATKFLKDFYKAYKEDNVTPRAFYKEITSNPERRAEYKEIASISSLYSYLQKGELDDLI